MKQRLKASLFSILGKDPEAVVVCFRTGDKALADAMCKEVRELEPSRKHIEIDADEPLDQVRAKLRPYRIGLAPALFDGNPKYDRLRRQAFLLAPRKILAYSGRLERHHLRLTTPIASWLFLRGVPLDRIYLRPGWLCPWRKDRTVRPAGHRRIEGRPRKAGRKSVAVLTPYFPYPLSHGGAVRMFNLLRETAREFDLVLYAFTEGDIEAKDLAVMLEFVSEVFLVQKPRYREPRWSSLSPPEVGEYWSPEMQQLLSRRDTDLLQTEYTYLASYGGDVLVEHDVTYDLYAQVRKRRHTTSAWWDWKRWHDFEVRAVCKFRRVVVMSEKDAQMLAVPTTTVIENGVDIGRFTPVPEKPGRRLLFIGSFRHFPNIVAFRYLAEQILPLVRDFELTVVAGPEPWLHWKNFTGTLPPAEDPRIRILEFVADVRTLYHEANLVLVPTLESAGTNVKVLESLSMQRAVVSTPSGAAGLGLKHGETVWIASQPQEFAEGIEHLLAQQDLRLKIATAGRAHAERHFDWRMLGLKQRALLRELLGDRLQVRPLRESDLLQVAEIQAASPEASQWEPDSYLPYDGWVAEEDGKVLGFLVVRETAPSEKEILNLAVAPAARRRGVAKRLLDRILANGRGEWFLEVRESNEPAIRFYESAGFGRLNRRENYYHNPQEAAIVMRFLS
jgi:polysaccharide biosynthesis protein PslH